MEKIIYLMRHSEPLKNINSIFNNDVLQIWNEKGPLSVNGEEKAKRLAELNELKNIDLVISSNYVRAICTAKYIADSNNIQLNIIEEFGERKFGINSWDELPDSFEQKQIEDIDFKMVNGESRREVANRMNNALNYVLENYSQNRIAIVSHATAITFLFMKLATIVNGNLIFNNRVVINKEFSWNAPDVFKLIFDDNNKLIDIFHISI